MKLNQVLRLSKSIREIVTLVPSTTSSRHWLYLSRIQFQVAWLFRDVWHGSIEARTADRARLNRIWIAAYRKRFCPCVISFSFIHTYFDFSWERVRYRPAFRCSFVTCTFLHACSTLTSNARLIVFRGRGVLNLQEYRVTFAPKVFSKAMRNHFQLSLDFLTYTIDNPRMYLKR